MTLVVSSVYLSTGVTLLLPDTFVERVDAVAGERVGA